MNVTVAVFLRGSNQLLAIIEVKKERTRLIAYYIDIEGSMCEVGAIYGYFQLPERQIGVWVGVP